MNNTELLKRVIHICETETHIQVALKRKENKDLKEFIIRSTPKLNDKKYKFINRVYWVYHNLTDFPQCQLKTCNKKLTDPKSFVSFKLGYRSHCCNKHAQIENETKEKLGDSVINNIIKNLGYNPVFNDIKEELRFWIKNNPKEISKILHSNLKKYILDAVNNYTDKLDYEKYTLATKMYWFLNDIKDFPKCKTCEKPLSDKNVQSVNKGYSGFCSWSCLTSNKDILDKKRQNNNEKFGCNWPLQNKEKQDMAKHTKQNKYGDENYNNRIQATQTNIKKYGGNGWVFDNELLKNSRSNYTYKNMNVKSSWELYKIIYHEDHNDQFEYQPNIKFEYQYDGKTFVYEPDFIVNGEIQEIKGDHFFIDKNDISKGMRCPFKSKKYTQEYLDGKYNEKYKCMVSNNIRIITSNDMKIIFDYINETYGKDYARKFKNNNS